MIKDKVCFITGSSRGIGLAVAKVFAAHGGRIVLNGRSKLDELHAEAEALRSEFGVEVSCLFGDVSDPDVVESFYRQIFKDYKRLDCLVNNAGILDDSLVGMVKNDAIDRTLAINTKAVIYNVRSASRLLQRSGGGSIINLSSIIGTNGNAGQVVYGASKAAVIGITKSASKELAPFQIRVNAIAPGFIDTDMTRGLPEAKFKERLASIKMGRIGTAQDIANTALFLASDLSSYVTGQVIGVDGGMLI